MADLIKIKGGSGEVPKLQERELAYSKDNKSLYIGTEGGNEKVGDVAWEQRIANLEGMAGISGEPFATEAYVDALIAEINARLEKLE
jgi:hypothetical protein